jgi:hypothetical protein
MTAIGRDNTHSDTLFKTTSAPVLTWHRRRNRRALPGGRGEGEGWAPDPSRGVIVSAQNQAGQIVASQRLSLRTSGARLRAGRRSAGI